MRPILNNRPTVIFNKRVLLYFSFKEYIKYIDKR